MRLSHKHFKTILDATKQAYLPIVYREVFHPAALCFLEEAMYSPPTGSRTALRRLAVFLHSRRPGKQDGLLNLELETEGSMATICHLIEMVEKGWVNHEPNSETNEDLSKCIANSISTCFQIVVPELKTCLPYNDLCSELMARSDKGLI